MIRDLRFQLGKMTFALVLLGLLAFWQLDFVLTGIQANIFLNCTILGLFAFGVVLVYRDVFQLENEIIAYQALKESFEDKHFGDEKAKADPLWKYYRANDIAIVYKKPKILAHAHQLVYEQIARFGKVSIDPSNVSALIDGVAARLSDKKSLLNYTAGLLIFLGLIGTFVGLMGTLASVGDILGSLDLSGSDPTESISNLMTNLQKPLVGMATGFSSSLFGLVTSLTLSVMARFAGSTFSSLLMELEEWLTGVSQLSGHDQNEEETLGYGGSAGINGEPRSLSTKELVLLLSAARHSLASNSRTRQQIEAMSTILRGVLTQTQKQNDEHQQLLGSISRMVDQNAVMAKTIDRYGRVVQEFHVEAAQNMDGKLLSLEERISQRQNQTQTLLQNVCTDIEMQRAEQESQALASRATEAELLKDLNASYQELKTRAELYSGEDEVIDTNSNGFSIQNVPSDVAVSGGYQPDAQGLQGRLASELGAEMSDKPIINNRALINDEDADDEAVLAAMKRRTGG